MRYSVHPTPSSDQGRTAGYTLYDHQLRRRVWAIAYPGYWQSEQEAITVCNELNKRHYRSATTAAPAPSDHDLGVHY